MPKNNDKNVYMQFGKSSVTGKRGIVLGKDGISNIDIIIIVIAVVIIIVSGILLFTNFRTLNRINDEISEMKVVLEEKQNTLEKLIELGKNEDLLRDNYERNLLYLPNSKDEIGIITDVTGVVEENGGLFRTITYEEEIPKENGIIDIPFTLRVNSTYETLNDIVAAFSQTDRLYVIDSLKIVESSTGSSMLIADLKMHTYYK